MAARNDSSVKMRQRVDGSSRPAKTDGRRPGQPAYLAVMFQTTTSDLVRYAASPHISPGDAMIAWDFLRLRALATDGIAVALPKGARARRRKKDRQGRIKRRV